MSDHTMTTWQREDGELIWGEYSHVTSTDWFQDDEPLRLVRRTWVLVEEVAGTYNPDTSPLCPECGGDPEWYGGCGTCDDDPQVEADDG